jgi:hypothetical protein
MNQIKIHADGGMTFSGEKATRIYQAAVLAKGIELLRKHGIRVNRSFTPTNMIARAQEITGQKFKPRAYAEAQAALEAWIERAKAEIEMVREPTDKGA